MEITQQEIDYIKRLFHIPRQYSGIDVALDSVNVHRYFKTCNVEEIRKKCEYVLFTEFGEEKYKWEYLYDEYGDSRGACAHHISFNRK